MPKYIPKKFQRYKKLLDEIEKSKNKKPEERILLVDGLNLYIRNFCVVPTLNPDGEHNGGIFGSIRSLRYAVRNLNPTRVFMIFDGRGGSAKRREIYEDYKANRRGFRGLNRTYNWSSPEEEEQSCTYQLNRFMDYLNYLPVTTFAVDGIEADDAIAYICRSILQDKKKVIVSTDKDYLQLVGEKTTVFSPTKKKIYDVPTIIEEFGIHPVNFLIFRMVEGDASDNIMGVPNVARKSMIKFYPEIATSDQITVDEVIERAKENADKYKKFKILSEYGDVMHRNYKLMDLRENNLMSGLAKTQILDIVQNQKIPPLNTLMLKKMFLKDKLYSNIRNFQSWFVGFQMLNTSAIYYNNKIDNKINHVDQ